MSFTPSDLVLLHTFKQGMDYFRQNPYYLDFIFERLIETDLDLQRTYGEKEIDRAKSWFLKNHIDVRLAYNLENIKFPCISIELLNQTESKQHAILGDVAAPVWNEDVSEDPYVIKPRVMAGPYPSVNYSITTGEVTLPTGFDTELVFANQFLFSPASQRQYTISSINLSTTNSFYIESGLRENFTGGFIAPAYQTMKVKRYIAQFFENYNFKVMVQGDLGQLIWLHTIVSYLLLKFRRTLLERKNINISSISSSQIMQENPDQYGGEIIYSRNISMDAVVETTWVDRIDEKLEAIIVSATPTMVVSSSGDSD